MNFIGAIKQFTVSLETQQAWLDTPVRREPLIVDATVTMNNMGRVYVERMDCDLACHVYEEALQLQTTILNKDAESVLETRTSLAISTARKGSIEHALQMFNSCLRSKKERYGQNSASATETLGIMGYLYTKIDSFENAETCLNAVRGWQQTNLDAHHPSCEQLDEIVQSCEDSAGRKFSIWV
jgi:tetratricopeptide (TPR) repeat protein